MTIPDNAPVWEISEPPREFKTDRGSDISIIDKKIAKLEQLIERLSDKPSPSFVGTGSNILNIDTGNVRKKYESMLSAEQARKRKTLESEGDLQSDHIGFEARLAFIDKAKASIQEDAYLMDEVLSKNSGSITIDYYNCDAERESLEKIITHLSEKVAEPPQIEEDRKYLTYHIKSDTGKDLFLLYSEKSGITVLKDDFDGDGATSSEKPATSSAQIDQKPESNVGSKGSQDTSPEASNKTEVSIDTPDILMDKQVYKLIFEAIEIGYPKKKELRNVTFYETYCKLEAHENVKDKLLDLFTKLNITGTKNDRTMMAAPIEHKIVTIFEKLVKAADISENLDVLEKWYNDDRTLDKKAMSGEAKARHNAISYDARKAIEEKELPFRHFSKILGYHHFFDAQFPYCVGSLREFGEDLPGQRKKDSPYYIKICPIFPLYRELTLWRNESLKSMLLSLQELNLRGTKKAEKDRIIRDIKSLANEIQETGKHLENFEIENLNGKEYFEHAITDLSKRINELNH